MTTKKLMLGAILAAAFLPAHAADIEADPPTRTFERHVIHKAGEAPAIIETHGFGPHTRIKFVQNAPYSAEMVTERQQNLADGNQITRTTTAMSYRDSAGRTRMEVRDPGGEVRAVTINDPAARVTYILRPKDKTATKVTRPGPDAVAEAFEAGRGAADAGRAGAEAARARIEQLRKDGKLPHVERRQSPDGEEIVIRQFHRVEHGKTGAAEEMRTQIGPVLANAFGDVKWSAKATTKDLGSREFDGVKAQGKLRSYEIPAGAIGNRNPITVSDESWHSPELQVTVYTRHSDPRSGDSVYRLQNLKRDEPPAALFTVPADYTVKDIMANIKRKKEEKAQ